MTMGHNIAPQINAWYAEIKTSDATAKERAADIGEKLLDQKKQLPHGQFMTWVKENCDFSQTNANDYMKVAEFKLTARREFDSAVSIRDALAKAKPKPQPKPNPNPNPAPKPVTMREPMTNALIQAGDSGLDENDLRDLCKTHGMSNPSNSIKQTLPHVDHVKIGDRYYDPDLAPGTDPVPAVAPQSVKDYKAKLDRRYAKLEKSLKAQFDGQVAQEAGKQSQDFLQKTLPGIHRKQVHLVKRLDRLLKSYGEAKIQPDEYKALRMALHPNGNPSEAVRSKAWQIFEKMDIRPFTEAEIQEQRDIAKRIKEIQESF